MENNHVEKLEKLEKYWKEAEKYRGEPITKSSMYKEQKETLEKELEELGTTYENAETKISELEKEIEEKLQYVEENLPIELIDKWNKSKG